MKLKILVLEQLNVNCCVKIKNIFSPDCFRSIIDFDEMAGGLNKRRMIQSSVYKELVKVCT